MKFIFLNKGRKMKKLLIICVLALIIGITAGPVFPLDIVGMRISDDKDNRYEVFDPSLKVRITCRNIQSPPDNFQFDIRLRLSKKHLCSQFFHGRKACL